MFQGNDLANRRDRLLAIAALPQLVAIGVALVLLSFGAGTAVVAGVLLAGLAGSVVGARQLLDRTLVRTAMARIREAATLSDAKNDAALDCLITIDESGRILEFNAGAETTFGHRRNQVIGRSIGEVIVPPALRAAHEAGLRRYVETGDRHVLGQRIEIEALHASGATFPVELAIAEVQLPHRRLFTAHLRDISERVRAEAALRESEARFRAIVEDQAELICRYDSDFRLTFTNSAHARLFDATPEDLLGRDFFGSIPERLRAGLRAELEALTVEAPLCYGANEKVRPDGEVRWLEWTNRAIFDDAGDRIGYQAVGRDITERRRAEDEIERQREALHQREKLSALGSLLAGVAHELNNPLSVVLGYAAILRRIAPDDPLRERADMIHEAANRCARIVRTFLAMARQKPQSHEPVALNPVIETALDIAAYGLNTSDVEVVRTLEADLPLVDGDPNQLHQVILNLLINAQQALQDKPAPRQLRVTSRRRGGHVEIEIADNGPGMSPEVQKRIFEPFYTTSPQGTGTGIGLAVCLGIVEAHAGQIEVTSNPDVGSRFVVRLPLGAPVVTAAPPPTITAPRAAGARILVVDDEPQICQFCRDVLAGAGHSVATAASGREALALLDDGAAFDLMLCDIRMADLDGPALWQALGKRGSPLRERTLFITGDTLGANVQRFLADGDLPVLEKPFDDVELTARVDQMLAGDA